MLPCALPLIIFVALKRRDCKKGEAKKLRKRNTQDREAATEEEANHVFK